MKDAKIHVNHRFVRVPVGFWFCWLKKRAKQEKTIYLPANALIRDLSNNLDELFPPSYSYSSISPPVVPDGSHLIKRSAAMSVVMIGWRCVYSGSSDDGGG